MSSQPVLSDRRRIVALVVAVVLIVGLIAWFALRSPQTTRVEPQPTTVSASSRTPSPSLAATTPADSTTPAASASPPPSTSQPPASTPTTPATSATSATATTAPPAAPATVTAGYCQPMTKDGFVPVRYEIERFDTDERVVSLGLDATGNIAAPPKSEPRTASWWNQGPAAGSDAGKTVLSIHTYRRGGALGNQLFEGGRSQLQPGDRIVLHGPKGEVACYDFVEAKKVFVEDYDPESDTMVDFDGDPLLTMIVCWDHRKGTDLWDSRVFFYAAPYVGD